MPNRALVVVAIVGLTALAVWGIDSYNGTVFDEPPEDYVTQRFGDAEFRHPPGWTARRVERRGASWLEMRAPRPGERLGPPALLRIRSWGEGTEAAFHRARLAARRLVTGKRFNETAYEIGVPESDASEASDSVFAAAGGSRHRVTTVFAVRGGHLTTITVRGRVTDRRDDPRNIAGSLRLGR